MVRILKTDFTSRYGQWIFDQINPQLNWDLLERYGISTAERMEKLNSGIVPSGEDMDLRSAITLHNLLSVLREFESVLTQTKGDKAQILQLAERTLVEGKHSVAARLTIFPLDMSMMYFDMAHKGSLSHGVVRERSYTALRHLLSNSTDFKLGDMTISPITSIQTPGGSIIRAPFLVAASNQIVRMPPLNSMELGTLLHGIWPQLAGNYGRMIIQASSNEWKARKKDFH